MKGAPMPIKEIMAVASFGLATLIVTHPLTWRTEMRRIQIAILRDVSDTRSWGNPSPWGGRYSWTKARSPRVRLKNSPVSTSTLRMPGEFEAHLAR